MNKFLFCSLLAFQCWGQKLHHQVIASQGANVKIATNLAVSQSVGQANGAIGNYKNAKLILGQGYIQSFGIAKVSAPSRSTISMMVYPNPIIELATFKFSSSIGLSATLYLFDNRGRLIYNHQSEPLQNMLTYDFSFLAEGVYFAKIQTSTHTFSTKIIKSK